MSARERRAKDRRLQRRAVARAVAPMAVSGVLFATAFAGAPAPAAAASLAVSQVANINTVGAGSNPTDITTVGGTAYFSAYKPGVGNELWKSDGTAGGTTLVDDIVPGAGGSYPTDLTNVGGTLYFTAADSSGTTELWRTDGTEAGTEQLTTGNATPYFPYLTNVGGTVYFASGGALWKSDGTPATTAEVAPIDPSFGYDAQMTSVGGTLYFVDGTQLWKSDGTANGTVEVPNAPSSGSISYLTNVGGTLYFTTSASGGELWKSDGTAPGTALVKSSFSGTHLTNLNGTLIFDSGFELWKSDGTAAGTQAVSTVPLSGYGAGPDITVADGKAFFFSQSGSTSTTLWETDGTNSGTVQVGDLSGDGQIFDGLTNVNGALFFDSNAKGLMYDDGTPGDSATVLGTSPAPVVRSGYLANLNGTLLFSGNDGTHGSELWRSDGTPRGTSQILDINAQGDLGSNPQALVNVNDTLYFTANDGAHGDQLWKSDGTNSGTTLVSDITALPDYSYLDDLTNFNGTLYFVANRQLYTSTGTAAGTVAIPNPAAVQVEGGLTAVGNTLFFVAEPSGGGALGLWELNGTTMSLVTSTVTAPTALVNVNGTLFFSGYDSADGQELWKSDGTSTGTTRVTDINPGAASSEPEGLTPLGASVYFWANDGTHGVELWESDGSTTQLVADVAPAPSSNYPPTEPALTPVGGTLYFAANDGTRGTELWSASGDTAHMVDDIQSGAAGSYPQSLTNVNGTVYFSASQGATGEELWSSDGTAAGTKPVRDINPGATSSDPSGLVNDNGLLVFGANDGTHGTELWQSDGTVSGTLEVDDIWPGATGSLIPYDNYSSTFVPVGNTLFFPANDGTDGTELWTATVASNGGGGGGSGGSSGGSGGGSGSGSGGGGSGGSGGPPPPPPPPPVSNGIPPELKFMATKVSGDDATIKLTIPGTSTGSYTINVTLSVVETMQGNKVLGVAASDRTAYKAKKKPIKKTVVVGTKTVQVTGGKTASLSVALNGAGKKLLALHHHLSVKLAASAKGKTLASKTLSFTAAKKTK